MRIHVKNVTLLVAAFIFTPFAWVVLFSGSDLSETTLLERRLADLRDRLHYAESLNQEREGDIHNLRNQIKLLLSTHTHGNMSAVEITSRVEPTINRTVQGDLMLPQETRQMIANMSLGSGDLSVPGMFNYLPHLTAKPEGLKPAFKLSQGRVGVSVVVGVPTIKRERESYLIQTLESLINNLNAEEKEDCLIIVFVAEPYDIGYVRSIADEVTGRFESSVRSGLVEVVSPSQYFYPNLNQLKETFGDPLERVKWRTKQNLDFAYLMMYARSRGTYYCQLEDDVITKPGYVSIMKNFALNQKTDDWLLLEFSYLGFIGKLFKSRDLPLVVEFFLMFHRDKPIDWLLDHLLYVKVCNPEKDSNHCKRSVSELRRRFKPSLFQHIGTHSSLKGKVQKLKDKDFNRAGLMRSHINPTADVSTTLRIYQHYSIDRAYLGETFFWGVEPKANDVITIQFTPAIAIEKFLFRSGNSEHPGDKFYNTTVEVLPYHPLDQQDGVLDNRSGSSVGVRTSDGYLVVAKFDPNTGIASGVLDVELGPIDVMRLRVHSGSETWIILSEIFIQRRAAS